MGSSLASTNLADMNWAAAFGPSSWSQMWFKLSSSSFFFKSSRVKGTWMVVTFSIYLSSNFWWKISIFLDLDAKLLGLLLVDMGLGAVVGSGFNIAVLGSCNFLFDLKTIWILIRIKRVRSKLTGNDEDDDDYSAWDRLINEHWFKLKRELRLTFDDDPDWKEDMGNELMV